MNHRIASVLLLATSLQNVVGFVPSISAPSQIIKASGQRTRLLPILKAKDEKSPMDIISMKVDIPDEVRAEIFQAEANTPAAKDRNVRIALYASFAIVGIFISSLNVFLSSVRADAGSAANDLSAINELGFGWAASNPISSFFLLNGIGGGIALITAGFGGTMVELENRTKNENAEKIWKELQRRRTEGEGGNKKKTKRVAPAKGKKKKNKKKKRLDALSEVIMDDKVESKSVDDTNTVEQKSTDNNVPAGDEGGEKDAAPGFMGKMKDFYEKADSMAASNALLLNKELEDRGVVEKITDESGLKVIGKDAASKLQEKKEE